MDNGLIIAYSVASVFSETLVKRCIRYLVGFSAALMIVGFWQKWAGSVTPLGWLEPAQIGIIASRIHSIFTNPNVYAIYLMGIIILASHIFLETQCRWQKWIWGSLLAGGIVSLYFTYSRSGWLIGFVYLGWFWYRFRKRKWIGLLFSGAFLAFAIIFWNDAWTRLMTLGDFSESTLGYRLRIWQGTFKALLDYWMWGAGPGSFARVYPWYQVSQTFADHAHQCYLQLWLEYGILALTGFVWFMVRLLYPFPTTGWPRTLGLTILCFLGFGLVESWYVQPFLVNSFWLFTGLLLAIGREGAA
jgi:O-antigen ligase